MEEKKEIKVRLSTVFLIIALILIVVLGALLYMQKTESEKQIAELENNASKLQETINDLQGKNDSIADTINTDNKENTSNVKEGNINDDSYVVIAVANENADGLESKYKMITNNKEKCDLIDFINNATKYESASFIPDFGDNPPKVIVCDDNGEKYTIAAGDQIDDGGNIVNLMTKWNSRDGSDKEMYKIDVKLAEYIEKLYDTVETAGVTSDREIYIATRYSNIRNMSISDFPEFIVLENDEIYLSTNLSDKILEGTYVVNTNNAIEYKILKESQDYTFYTSAVFSFESFNGEKNIVVDNSTNGKIYYQKIH